MRSMSSRQRVLSAVFHREPDQVPIDVGGTMATGINFQAYEELLRFLGMEEGWELESYRGRTARVSEEVRRRLHADVVNVPLPGPAPRRVWQDGALSCYEDEWGVRWACPPDGHYYTIWEPFAGEPSMHDLRTYPWPDPMDEVWTAGLMEKVAEARRLGDYAVCLSLPVGFIHQTQFLRGYEAWLTDLLLDRPFIEALMDAVLEVQLEIFRRALALVGEKVDLVAIGDDIGFQNGPMVSPALYDAVIAPRQRRLFRALRETAPAALFYHTCGSILPMIPRLIDMGVQILNPVQVSAAGMDTAVLKREYGRDICFWGAVDTQQVLPMGSPEEVRAEVRRRIDDLTDGGGYVLAAVHHVQHGVPPQNIIAMCDETLEYGRRRGAEPSLAGR